MYMGNSQYGYTLNADYQVAGALHALYITFRTFVKAGYDPHLVSLVIFRFVFTQDPHVGAPDGCHDAEYFHFALIYRTGLSCGKVPVIHQTAVIFQLVLFKIRYGAADKKQMRYQWHFPVNQTAPPILFFDLDCPVSIEAGGAEIFKDFREIPEDVESKPIFCPGARHGKNRFIRLSYNKSIYYMHGMLFNNANASSPGNDSN